MLIHQKIFNSGGKIDLEEMYKILERLSQLLPPYNIIILVSREWFVVHTRVYGCYTSESILATAFGRSVDLLKGESDEFSKAMDLLVTSFGNGEIEQFILFNSKFVIIIIILTLNMQCSRSHQMHACTRVTENVIKIS
jgi:hypothetical protein